MKLNMKRVLLCSLLCYSICRFKLHFSIGVTASINKSSLFILFNFIILLMLIIHNFFGTSDTDVTNDNHLEEFDAEFFPYQSNVIIVHEAMSDDSLPDDELVEEKSIILVEKYATTEEEYYEEEEIILDIVLSKEADTGWQHNLIRESVHRLELVVVEDLIPEVNRIVCVDNEYDKLDLDAINQKFDEFIGMQKRKWQLDAAKQLQFAKI